MVKRTKIKVSELTGKMEKEVTVYYFLFIPVYKSTKEIVYDL